MTVYVMGCEDTRLVKIGHTGDPARRLREIQVLAPSPLRLLWESTSDHGEATERNLHLLFKGYRKHGEWFDFGECDAVALVKAAADLPRIRPNDYTVVYPNLTSIERITADGRSVRVRDRLENMADAELIDKVLQYSAKIRGLEVERHIVDSLLRSRVAVV
jgi:hypothetical protein